jgi:predicted ATPase with chaperone activity
MLAAHLPSILPPLSPAEGSGEVRERVARAIQAERYGALGLTVRTNAEAGSTVLEQIAKPDPGGLTLLREASDAMRLSTRGYHRILRVARSPTLMAKTQCAAFTRQRLWPTGRLRTSCAGRRDTRRRRCSVPR